MTNQRLRQRIKDYFLTIKNFAEHIGMSPSAVSRRLNGEREWEIWKAKEAAELLCIQERDIDDWFYPYVEEIT